MGAKRPSSHEVQKFRKDFLDRGRALQHLVGNACELDDLGKEPAPGRDEGLERIDDLIALHDGRADLDDRVVLGRKTRRLEVKGDVFVVEACVKRSMDGDAVVYVVDVVALAAVENLDVLGRVHRIRERLRAAVVGNRDGLVPPALGALDDVPVRARLGKDGG